MSRLRRFAWFDFNDHEWSVLAPLVFTGFFEHYDQSLLAIGAPPIYRGLGVSEHTFALAEAVIRLGALGSVVILRWADRVGRRRGLVVSIVSFTLLIGVTALSPALWFFTLFQFVGRAFLSAEGALANVVIAEEIRPDRRGAALGMFGILTMAGFGLVAVMIPVVNHSPLGWRLFYIVVLAPLGLVAYLRRNLKETKAFEVARAENRVHARWWPDLDPVSRGRLLRCSALFGIAGMVAIPAFYYASALAQGTWRWSGIYTLIILGAGPFSLLGYLLGGRGSDAWGRKPLLVLSAVLGSSGFVVLFSEVKWLYAVGFYLMATGGAVGLSLTPIYLAELFPTQIRATVGSLVLAVNVAAGSLGLAAAAALSRVWDTSVIFRGAAVLSLVSLLFLRGLPETVGADVVAGRGADGRE